MWSDATKGAQVKRETLDFKFDVKTSLNSREFEGYGSTFGNVDLGDDVVLPGAFKETLADHETDGALPQMFWMHQMDQVCGKWTAMSEDKNGLYCKGILADTPRGNEVRTLLNMKAVRGLSIGFSIPDRSTDMSYNEDGTRLIHKVDLWEVSVVSLPMNPMAQVTASKALLLSDPRATERRLRDAGFTQSEAKCIISGMKHIDAIGARDVDRATREVEVDDEAAEVLKMLHSMTTSMVAGAFKI
jgi:HK97 family phage prohead protease